MAEMSDPPVQARSDPLGSKGLGRASAASALLDSTGREPAGVRPAAARCARRGANGRSVRDPSWWRACWDPAPCVNERQLAAQRSVSAAAGVPRPSGDVAVAWRPRPPAAKATTIRRRADVTPTDATPLREIPASAPPGATAAGSPAWGSVAGPSSGLSTTPLVGKASRGIGKRASTHGVSTAAARARRGTPSVNCRHPCLYGMLHSPFISNTVRSPEATRDERMPSPTSRLSSPGPWTSRRRAGGCLRRRARARRRHAPFRWLDPRIRAALAAWRSTPCTPTRRRPSGVRSGRDVCVVTDAQARAKA
jgi:hypothetical protein